MLVNLAQPYSPLPARPRSEDIAFYAPSRPDFLFPATQLVQIVCAPLRRSLRVEWALCRNRLTSPLATGKAFPDFDNSLPLVLDMNGYAPGFYDLSVRIILTETQSLEAVTTFGWRADDEALPLNPPRDFDAFWQDSLALLPPIELGLRCEHVFTLTGDEIGRYNLEHAALPEHYDPDGERFRAVEIYRVQFLSASGTTVHGWYAVPAGTGPFPGMLVLPGAGNKPRPAPVEHARHGYAALDIQVHGFPVDSAEYPPLPEPGDTAPEDYPARPVYLNAVQAARALAHLPKANPARLAVVGGSQGGLLAIVTAALEPSIRAAVPAITHFACRPWVQWTERCNELRDPGRAGFTAADILDTPRTRTESYYDAAHFAAAACCPVLMNMGLIDPVSPPGPILRTYRQLSGPKELVPLPNLAHDWSPAFDRYAWRWLAEALRPPA